MKTGSGAKIRQLGIKELRALWHDWGMLFVLIVSFTINIQSAALASRRELHNAPIAIVDQDRTELSGRIANAFFPPRFRRPVLIERTGIDAGLDTARYTFVLDIPPDFQRDVLAGRQPALQVNIDATQMTQAFIGDGYIREIVSGEVNGFLQRVGRATMAFPGQLTVHVRFNPNLEGTWFGGVMEIINMITMLSIILTGAAVLREREHGTLEHLLVMPLRPFEIMAAKVWANGLVVLVAATLSLLLVVRGWLGVPIAGSVALFVCGAALYLFSTTSIGILLGTVARSMPQLGLLSILIILPLELLSGSVTPRESQPLPVQTIMLGAPTTHFVMYAQAILYRGAGLDVVWPEFLIVIGLGAVFFLVALSRFRKSITLTQL